MQIRRMCLAFSLAASAASMAFADLSPLESTNQSVSSPDRLELLTQTLSSGGYTHPDDMNVPANVAVKTQQRNADVVELNNTSLANKYVNKTSTYSTNSTGYSWMVAHPLPNMKRVSSNYGGRVMGGRAEKHSGLDLSASSGTPIYATGAGIVTKSGWGTGYGQYVEINHGNGYITRYAHASRLVARVGEQVKAGDQIANVGCTGRCTGPHLHFEVVKDGQRKNPSSYLAMLP